MKRRRLTQSFRWVVATFLLVQPLRAERGENPTDLTQLTLEQLMNISIVAATKTNTPQLGIPQAVAVLTRTDIQRLPAQTIGDLLRTLVGANVVKTQSSQNILSVRGSNPFSPSKILILIDGQPIVPTLFSTTWWDLLPVNIPDIEKIEFIRSPGTIYGANAQHGVVNIVTRRLPLDGSRDQRLIFESKVGQQDLRQAYLGYLGRAGRASYRLSSHLANHIHAYYNPERLQIVPGKLSAPGEQTFERNRTQLDLQTFSAGLETRLLQNPLTAAVGFSRINNAQGRVPDRLCFVGLEGYVGYAHLTYSFPALGMTNTISAGSDLTNYWFVRNSDTEELAPTGMSLRRLNIGYEVKRDLGRSHNLLAGLGYSVEDATADSRSLFHRAAGDQFTAYREAGRLSEGRRDCGEPCSRDCSTTDSLASRPAPGAIRLRALAAAPDSAARVPGPSPMGILVSPPVENEPAVNVYAQDEWRVSQKGTVYYGGLFSHHYVAGNSFSPMLAYVHKFNPSNSFRIGTFTSHRNPNVFEHSLHYDQISGASSKRTLLHPNRDLVPERTTSYEIGFRSQATKRLAFAADFYINQVRDSVEWTLTGVLLAPTPRPTYRSENSLAQTIRGVELTGHYDLHKNWVLESGLSLTKLSSKSKNREFQGPAGRGLLGIGQGRYGSQYAPPYIHQSTVRFERNRVHATFQYQRTGRHNWQWPSWNPKTGQDEFSLKPVPAYGVANLYAGFDIARNLEVALEAYNLFNDRHTEWRGDESYFGRAIRVKLSFTLGKE